MNCASCEAGVGTQKVLVPYKLPLIPVIWYERSPAKADGTKNVSLEDYFQVSVTSWWLEGSGLEPGYTVLKGRGDTRSVVTKW